MDSDATTYQLQFPVGKDLPPLDVLVSVYEAEQYHEKGQPFSAPRHSLRIEVSIKGQEHPYLKQVIPGGSNYSGNETKNPALLSAVSLLTNTIEHAIRHGIKDHKLDKSLKDYSLARPFEFVNKSSDVSLGMIDFNPRPVMRLPNFVQAEAAQVEELFEDITIALDAVTPKVEEVIKKSLLHPRPNPTPAELKKFTEDVKAAFENSKFNSFSKGRLEKRKEPPETGHTYR